VIAIVDYGAGNLRSVKKAFDFLGFETEITASPEVVRSAEKIVLPGVGHFASTDRLTASGLRDAIADSISQGKPFLGICVGMQWLFSGSTEAPQTPGLGVIAGSCERFPFGIKVPHVGWNSLCKVRESQLLGGVEQNSFVYFTHSFRAPVCEATSAIADYGTPFAAVVERDNTFGVQFHPEKSGAAGLQLLKNFGELPC
jgi:imidazole glycerol-phosphate synthase subunit HisH